MAVQLASDNFDRADSASLGANWTGQGGATAGIVSNQCGSKTYDSGADCFQLYSAITWPNDHYSEVKLVVQGTGTGAPGPAVRMASGTKTAYICYCNAGGTQALVKFVAGAFTSLIALPTLVAGDVIRLQVMGTALIVYQNGVAVANTTDASISSGSAGLNAGVSTDRLSDNWSGGDTTEIGMFT